MDEHDPEGIRQVLESARAYDLSVRDAQATITAYLDDVHQAAVAIGSMQPAFRVLTEYLDQVRRTADIVRVTAPLVEMMQQNADLIRRSLMLPAALASYADQTDLAITAGLAQLSRAQQAASLVVTPSFWPGRQHTAQASLVVTPTFTAAAEVAPAEAPTPSESGQGEDAATHRQVNRAGLAVMLVYVVALCMSDAQVLLPQEVKDYLNSLVAYLSLALAIHMAVNDWRKP